MWVWPIGSISDWDVLSGPIVAIWPGQADLFRSLKYKCRDPDFLLSRVDFCIELELFPRGHLTWIFCSRECISERIELELFRETLNLDCSLVGNVTKKVKVNFCLNFEPKKKRTLWQKPDNFQIYSIIVVRPGQDRDDKEDDDKENDEKEEDDNENDDLEKDVKDNDDKENDDKKNDDKENDNKGKGDEENDDKENNDKENVDKEEDLMTETWWFLEWEYILKGLVGAVRHMPWQINIYGRLWRIQLEFTPTQNTAQGFVFETRP